MPVFWGGMTLGYGVAQTIGGFGYVKLFSLTGEYVTVSLVGAGSMVVSSLFSLNLSRRQHDLQTRGKHNSRA